ncbi:hypothetical protein H0H92_003845 [Tricholoma furcatifolium]|nr:hypothetical protein H0H92_003845 [Tricholoma furcatifolium]
MSTVTEDGLKKPIPVGSNPTNSRDFCNSFWGSGNRGPKTLFGRMELAQTTIKELQKFFNERSQLRCTPCYALEFKYSWSKRDRVRSISRLWKDMHWTKRMFISALRDVLEALRRETEKQAAYHSHLSFWIFNRCNFLVPLLQAKYVELQLGLQREVEKKLKEKGEMEREVLIAREKYEADCTRVFSLIGQTQNTEEQKQEQTRLLLCQARDTAEASQKELGHCTERLRNCVSEWEVLWKNFCDRCEGLEERRLLVMKHMLWDNANDFSTAGVGDCDSWDRIRISLDQLEPEEDLKAFVDICGTGNNIPDPPTFTPHNLNAPNTEEPPAKPLQIPALRQATFNRVPQTILIPSELDWQPRGQAESVVVSPPQYSNGSPKILFYVKARQEYTATSRDHLSFKKGDIIAVTSAGDDVRWRGDLVDAARRQEGRHFFPRTHVSMVQNAAGEPLRPKLFYVKALFDFTADTASKLNFKKGDIIAVTQVGETSWWKGEHYDDALGERGRELVSYTCVIPAYNGRVTGQSVRRHP